MSERQVYSYHTFLFPFIWKTNTKIKKEEFLEVLSIKSDNTGRWISDNFYERTQSNEAAFLSDYWMQDYAAYQYFTAAANDLISNSSGTGSAVSCYRYNQKFKVKDKDNKDKYLVKYIIEKKGKTYNLDINNIRLNVYDSGIAILILEMENCEHKSLDDVNAINEHGRRINFPFLVSGDSHVLCADSIEIKFKKNDKEISIKENFLETSERIKAKIESSDNSNVTPIEKDDLSFTYIMKPIQVLLDGHTEKNDSNNSKSITTNPNHRSDKKFYIKPCVDDRMFVCCLVADAALSDEIRCINQEEICYYQGAEQRLKKVDGIVLDGKGNSHDTYMEGWSDETTLSNRIYKFMYIENSLSCQESEMKKQILSDSVYRRWLYSGTLFGITHHSLCCITNPVVKEVINPFLTQYVQMAILTLAQRAVVLLLEDEVATVSNKFSEDVNISEQDIAEIERLQAKYVKVQNQMLLSEVTVQEQGVEIYEMLRKQLYIEKNMSDLNSSMNNLRDVANSTNARLERQSDKNKEKMEKERAEQEKKRADDQAKKEKERAEQRAKLERKEDKQFALISILLATMFIVEPLSQVIANVILKKEIEWNEKTIAALSWLVISAIVLISSYIIFKKKNDTTTDTTNNNTNTNNNGTATNNTNTNTNNNGTTNNTTIN